MLRLKKKLKKRMMIWRMRMKRKLPRRTLTLRGLRKELYLLKILQRKEERLSE